MSTLDFDHRREARDLLIQARTARLAGDPDTHMGLTFEAQAHATLAASAPAHDDQYWEQARELEKLQAAVRDYLEELRLGRKGGRPLAVMRTLAGER